MPGWACSYSIGIDLRAVHAVRAVTCSGCPYRSLPPRRSSQPKRSKSSGSLALVPARPSQPKKAQPSFKSILAFWEKANAQRERDAEKNERMAPTPDGVRPLMSMLRPCNIIGGGFGRTPGGCIPRFVHSYWQRKVAGVA